MEFKKNSVFASFDWGVGEGFPYNISNSSIFLKCFKDIHKFYVSAEMECNGVFCIVNLSYIDSFTDSEKFIF